MRKLQMDAGPALQKTFYALSQPKQSHTLEVSFVNPNFNGDSSRSSETIMSLEAKKHRKSRAVTYRNDASDEHSDSSTTTHKAALAAATAANAATVNPTNYPPADRAQKLYNPKNTILTYTNGNLIAIPNPGNGTPRTTSSSTPHSIIHSANGQLRIHRNPTHHFFYEEQQSEASKKSASPRTTADDNEDEQDVDPALLEEHYKDFYDYQKFADIPIRHSADLTRHLNMQFPVEVSTGSEISFICAETNVVRTYSGTVGVKISPIRSLQQPKGKANEKKPRFDKKDVRAPPFKTFAEANFGICTAQDWDYVKHPSKLLAHEYILTMVREGSNTDVKVYIGKLAKFKCHSIVLKAYSELCREMDDLTEVHLPDKCITPIGFVSVYEWMINDCAQFDFDGIVEFYEAATYMRIPMLVKQIWEYLDDCDRFSEERACFTYLTARHRNIELVAEIMLRRINNFFIVFVATQEFLTITVHDLCKLISSSLLGVNTEIELLMVAVYWLNHNWPTRKCHAVEVMRNIRFSIMPTLYIVNLHTKTKLCPEVERCIDNRETEQMIYGGFVVGHIDRTKLEPIEEYAFEMDNKPVARSDERKWMFDHNCEYHHTSSCINKHLLTYKTFVRHLKMVSTAGEKYYYAMNLVSADTPGLRCCDGPKLK